MFHSWPLASGYMLWWTPRESYIPTFWNSINQIKSVIFTVPISIIKNNLIKVYLFIPSSKQNYINHRLSTALSSSTSSSLVVCSSFLQSPSEFVPIGLDSSCLHWFFYRERVSISRKQSRCSLEGVEIREPSLWYLLVYVEASLHSALYWLSVLQDPNQKCTSIKIQFKKIKIKKLLVHNLLF